MTPIAATLLYFVDDTLDRLARRFAMPARDMKRIPDNDNGDGPCVA